MTDDPVPCEPGRSTVPTVVLFDGVCNLCNASVNRIIDRDPEGRCRFLALQTPAGRALAERAGLNPDDMDTAVAISAGRAHVRSSAVLAIASRLRPPLAWLARIGWLVPRVLRDAAYRLVAASRYTVFGRRDSCRMPTPDREARFLDPHDPEWALRAAGYEPGGVRQPAVG